MAEVENIAIEEARELVSNRLLWPLVRDFLWDFAPQVNGTWLEGLEWHETSDARREEMSDASHVSRLMSNSRVKRHILSLLGVESCFYTFPKEDGSRLLLLDGATLESVVKWLGALACAGALRHVTDGATVRELKAELPGVYPEVFSYTMYFGSLEAGKFGSLEVSKSRGLEVSKFGSLEVEKVGCGILLQSLSSLPAPLMHRLTLKLPKKMSTMDPPNLQTSKLLNFETSRLPNLKTSIFKLLKLKFPEAYKLCCS